MPVGNYGLPPAPAWVVSLLELGYELENDDLNARILCRMDVRSPTDHLVTVTVGVVPETMSKVQTRTAVSMVTSATEQKLAEMDAKGWT